MSDNKLLNEIEDVLTNLYSIDYEPFNIEELRTIVDSIVSIIDKRNPATTEYPGVCELCKLPLPTGEEMFMYHGYSGPCPTTNTEKEK